MLVAGGVVLTAHLLQKNAQETRVAENLTKAFEDGDVDRLSQLAADPEGAMDDDAIMEFFKDHVVEKGLLYEKMWNDPRLSPFRNKIIKELGDGYTSDDEAAFRYFVAKHESTETAEKVWVEMDSSDKEEFSSVFAHQ